MKCSKCESEIGDESRYFETREYIPSYRGLYLDPVLPLNTLTSVL